MSLENPIYKDSDKVSAADICLHLKTMANVQVNDCEVTTYEDLDMGDEDNEDGFFIEVPGGHKFEVTVRRMKL